eukprot:3692508-Rhodomonas_salina.2
MAQSVMTQRVMTQRVMTQRVMTQRVMTQRWMSPHMDHVHTDKLDMGYALDMDHILTALTLARATAQALTWATYE